MVKMKHRSGPGSRHGQASASDRSRRHEAADLVTETTMVKMKHPFRTGVEAQGGIGS